MHISIAYTRDYHRGTPSGTIENKAKQSDREGKIKLGTSGPISLDEIKAVLQAE